MQRDIRCFEFAGACQAGGLQKHLVGLRCVRAGWLCGSIPGGGELPAQHGLDQGVVRQVGGQVFTDQFPVAQHRDAVTQGIYLVQEMRDKQNGHAVVAQFAQNGEESFDLVVIQAGGGLIQNQYLCRDTESARDRHHLLHRHRVGVQVLRHVDVQIERSE